MSTPPSAILLFAGRWSSEKRIHLLLDVVPDGAALVIVGDGTAAYAQQIASHGKGPHLLPLRKMLNGTELRIAYAAADLFCSASNFETLGNSAPPSRAAHRANRERAHPGCRAPTHRA
jgi:glycosyltransferase involved in cell wall biosynthesis